MEVGIRRRNAPNLCKEGEMSKGRFDHLLKQYSLSQMQKKICNLLERSKPVVEVNGSGTTGYRFKNGPNKDRVAGHIKLEHPNKNYQ
jgi:hypothetical protein